MNRAFALVWNTALGAWVVTHELARNRRKGGSVRRGMPQMVVLLAGAALPALGWAACTPAVPATGATVTCSGLAVTSNSFASAVDSLVVNVLSGTQMTAGAQGGTAVELTGRNPTVNNAGTIDPSVLGAPTDPSTGLRLSNLTSDQVVVNNLSSGSLYGAPHVQGPAVTTLQGVALHIESGTSGTVAINNAGFIGARPVIDTSVVAADAPVIAVKGGSMVNAVNTGTIEGRVAFEGSNTGNNFINAGTINGSVSLGEGARNSFTAVTGSEVNAAGGVATESDSYPGLVFAGAGVVDGGGNGGNDLILQNAVAGTGSGADNQGTVSTDQYRNFGRLTVNSGTWTLGGTTPFSTLALNGGVLRFSNPAMLGNEITANGGAIESLVNGATLAPGYPLTVNPGGLTVTGGNDLTLFGTFGGAGGITKQGSGTLTLSGSNATTGRLTVAGGRLVLGNVGAIGSGDITLSGGELATNTSMTLYQDITVSGNGTLGVNADMTLTGLLEGNGRLVKTGAGTLTLDGLGLMSGTLQLDNGTLLLRSAGSLVLPSIDARGGSLDVDVPMQLSNVIFLNGELTVGARGNQLSLNGPIIGGGELVKAGTGALYLGNSNTFWGLTLRSGSLYAGASASFGQGTVTVTGTSTMGTMGPLTLANNIALQAGQLTWDGTTQATLSGTLSGGGALIKTGNNTLTLTGTNVYTGGTQVAGGTLRGSTQSLQGNIEVDAGTQLVFDQATAGSFAGALSGSGQVLKQGIGTLVANGNNSPLSGATSVTGGRLVVGGSAANAGAYWGGDVQVGAGATLGGHGTLTGNVTLASGATLAPGNSIGTLTVAGNLNLQAGSVLDFELGTPNAINPFTNPGQGDSVVVGGNLTINGADLNITNAGGMGPGMYRLFTWGGFLNLANAGTMLPGPGYSLQVLSSSRQINLISTAGSTLQFWNANGLASGTQAGGGSGTWSNATPVWTDANGTITSVMAPNPGFGIFSGAPGTVTVDNGSGAVSAYGLQFASDGYVVSGDTLTLVADAQGNAPLIRVGDGSAPSAGVTTTINAVLTGSAGLNKTDPGTLVLNAANTWTGDTRISGGTVSIAAESALGDASSNLVLDGGALRVTGTGLASLARGVQLGDNGGGFDVADAAHTFTVAQALNGNGALVKRGEGRLVLTGNNGYTGGTLVEQGVLQGDTTSLTGSIVNNARVVFEQTVDGTHSGVLSGSGELVKQGQGTLTLLGSNSYTGGTVIAQGTLQGTTESLQGSIANATALVVDQDVDGTLNAAISGGGSLTKRGDGTVTLTGSNTYFGGTFIEAGTLKGSAAALRGAIQNDGRLLFDQAEDTLFAATLTGTGHVDKTGAGTLVVRDAQGFSGVTDIQQGTLVVGDAGHADAALGGRVSIGQAATLKGIGRIGALDLSGTLAPGNSIGTLHVSGDATLQATGRYEVEVDADGRHDLLAVDGRATILGGAVLGLAEGAAWNPLTQYTILTAQGGVSGTFGTVSSNLAFLAPSLDYSANAVTLSLRRNQAAFPSVGQTRNQVSTATAIESIGAGGLYGRVLTMDADTARQAFDAYSGELRASTQVALFDDAARVRRGLLDRLTGGPQAAQADVGGFHTGWATTWGHWGHTDATANTAYARTQGTGWMTGVDVTLDNAVVLGAALGQARSQLDVKARDSDARTNSKYAALYGAGTLGDWVLRGGLSAARSDNRLTRRIEVADTRQTLASNDDARLWQGFVELAHGSDIGQLRLEPYLNYARVQLEQDAFAEHGGDAALTGAKQQRDLDVGTAGLRTYWQLDSRFHTTLVANLGYQRAWGDTETTLNQRFVAGGAAFEVGGMPLARNAGVAEIGFSTQLTPRVAFKAEYQGRFGSGVQDQGAQLSLSARF